MDLQYVLIDLLYIRERDHFTGYAVEFLLDFPSLCLMGIM